jgi:hypothetical protein
MYNFRVRWLLLPVLALSLFGCAQLVPIPASEQDAKPVIHVGAVPSGGGDVNVSDAYPGSCVSPCKNAVAPGTQLTLSISAQNPGGVKTLSAVIAETGKPSYGVATESQPNPQGLVPTGMTILGHNGAGGIGNIPIGATMNNPTGTFSVLVSATNYNNMTSLYSVVYYVRGHVQANLEASPASIPQGGSATLKWSTTNASSVEIAPLGQVPPSGSMPVTPNFTTTYTLTAKDWLESTSRTATVTVTAPLTEGCLNNGFGFYWNPISPPSQFTFDVGVRFHGTLASAPVPGSTADMQFTKDKTETFSSYAGQKGLALNVCGLMPGTWSVTATVISGPLKSGQEIACTAIVPGSVSFDYDHRTCAP